MPQCVAYNIAAVAQCHSVAREGDYCRRHARIHARYTEEFGPRQPDMCHFVSIRGRCGNLREGENQLCMAHRHEHERHAARREEDEREEQEVTEGYQQYMDHVPPLGWQEVLVELVNRSGFPRGFPGYLTRDIAKRIGRMYFMNPEVNLEHHRNQSYFVRFWHWLARGGPERNEPAPEPIVVMPPTPPPAAPVPRLQALARDNQNVHTREVSQQTNDSTRKLLEVVVPLQQKTEQTLMLSWYSLPNAPPHYKILRTSVDINKWFNTETCRQQGDKLYKHLLRGLVAYIGQVQDLETRQELWKRAYQECDEAVGMCCEGHISRLCNVLVGFDEAFQPPVPFSEILQNKMAAIFAMDVSAEEKIQHANSFFNEYAVPVDQRQAWLDAFSQD